MVNAAVFAMKNLQDAMKGAADQAGWESEDDVGDYVSELRTESR